jgi:citrate lyase beta subunit
MSRHLTEYNVVPAGAVIRINLAWEPSLDKLGEHLDELTHHIFLDVPCGRKKPPNHSYTMNDIMHMVLQYRQIKYVAISQIEEVEQVQPWVRCMGKAVNIVPKIESRRGIENIRDITDCLGSRKTIMLDHDDLFQEMIVNGVNPDDLYEVWIKQLLIECKHIGVRVLRTAGVVFSDK